ncbi:MAG: thiol:disulfide interchange protein [Candidatus Azotimanducaceae bacterium]
MKVDTVNDAFTVSYDESALTIEHMFTSIEALGYDPSILQSNLTNSSPLSELDLPEAVLSLQDGKTPLLIYFGARWCGACKIMERTTLIDNGVSAALTKYKYLKVDIEKDAVTATAFSISAVPTLVVLNAQGSELYRHVGPLTVYEMRLVLDQFTEMHE